MIALDVVDVVVIDDDLDLRMLTTLTFEMQGWSVATAADGPEGLQLLTNLCESGARPAVLLDVQMPEIDGWEVLARIRTDATLRDLGVLLCTVRAGEQDRVRGFQIGADDFVPKPFDIDGLVDQVRAVMETPAARRAQLRRDRPSNG
ncbi:MAG: response regulator [Acidimicrobiales bacterium]|nr:response regulator [Acidimicrobiales bacterium]